MNHYPEFAALLEQHLQRMDRSAAWLAKGLQLDASTVAKWRSGDSRPKDPETVMRLADLLGVHKSAEREALLRAAGYGYLEMGSARPSSTLRDSIQTPSSPLKWVAWGGALGRPLWAGRWIKQAWLWIGAGWLGLALLVGLSYPLLWEWPMARLIVAGLVAIVLLGLAGFAWRQPARLIQIWNRTDHPSPFVPIGAFSLLALSLVLWIGIGLPRLWGQWPYLGHDEDGDRFGYAVTNADFNNDGFADLAVGAPGKAATRFNPQSRTGWVYTFTGTHYYLLPSVNLGQAGLDYNQNGDQFGWAVATGDFNGDGIADLAVGAPGKTNGDAVHSGYVCVFKGTTHGLVPWQSFDQHLLGHNETGDQFGWALAAGDFNHDGIDDLAIGAPYEAPNASPRSGYVFIFTGGANGFTQWFGVERQAFTPDQNDDQFGWALAAGDFDHNGITDLAIGAPGVISETNPSHAPTGHVYIFHNASGEPPQPWLDLRPPLTNTQPAGNRFGAALVAADFDDDSWVDLAIGAPGALPATKPARLVAGAVYLMHNQRSGLVFWQRVTALDADINQSNLFGWALAVGDFNQDAQLDLAVGAPGQAVVAADGKRKSGRVFTFKNVGNQHTDDAIMTPWQNFTEPPINRAQFNDYYGWSLTSGDLDHDGADDLAVSAPGGEPGLHWVAGNVFTYRGSPNGLTAWTELFQAMTP